MGRAWWWWLNVWTGSFVPPIHVVDIIHFQPPTFVRQPSLYLPRLYTQWNVVQQRRHDLMHDQRCDARSTGRLMANRYPTYSPSCMKFLLLHLATFGAGRLQEGPVANGSNEQRTLVGGKMECQMAQLQTERAMSQSRLFLVPCTLSSRERISSRG